MKICSWKHLFQSQEPAERNCSEVKQSKILTIQMSAKLSLLVPTSAVFSHSVYKYHSSCPPFAPSCCFWVTWLACFSDWLAFMISGAPLSSEVLFFGGCDSGAEQMLTPGGSCREHTQQTSTSRHEPAVFWRQCRRTKILLHRGSAHQQRFFEVLQNSIKRVLNVNKRLQF